jgi:hypothetical protein
VPAGPQVVEALVVLAVEQRAWFRRHRCQAPDLHTGRVVEIAARTTVETSSAALPIAWGEISGRESVVAIQLTLRISGGKVCPTALRGIPGVHACEEK